MGDNGGNAEKIERSDDDRARVYPATAVRYGKMSNIGEFTYSPNMQISAGSQVVVTTDRGIELGEQVELTCPACPLHVSTEKIHEYASRSGEDVYKLGKGRILRVATEADLSEMRHIESELSGKLETCRRFAGHLGLQIRIVDCEHILGGERVVFYFLADERVDFRELVRKLAGEFQTRIEMRQIGARDEARLLADLETCGRECCCRNFLKTLKPISMSMAKLQKTTLDIAKVSGRCGRLKCCLRFEYDHYQDLDKSLPRIGTRITTDAEAGRVIDRQILTQLVRIRTDDGRIVTVAAESILVDGASERGPEAIEDESLVSEAQPLQADITVSDSDEDLFDRGIEELKAISTKVSIEDEPVDGDVEEVLSEQEPADQESGSAEDQADQADGDKDSGEGKSSRPPRRRKKRRRRSRGRRRKN